MDICENPCCGIWGYNESEKINFFSPYLTEEFAMLWNLLEKKRIVLVKSAQNTRINMNEGICNCIEAFVETKMYQSINWQLDCVKKVIKTYNRALVNSEMNNSLLKAAQEFLIHINIAVVFMILILMTNNWDIQTAFILSFMLYLFTNMRAFTQIISTTLDIKATIYQGKKIYSFFADYNLEKISECKSLKKIKKIQIVNVAHRYTPDHNVLNNINIHIDSGNHIAFVGRKK